MIRVLTIGFSTALLILTVVIGCAVPTVTSREIDYSTLDIQKAILATLNIGIEPQEGIERIYHSKPFRTPAGRKLEVLRSEDQVRAIAKITVLGDRRPYVVETSVRTEKKEGSGKWSISGEDQRLARQLADQIQDYLVKHKDKNLIDHFRAF
jgi:hypothetical protein